MRRASVLCLVALLGCGGALEVEIETAVGARAHREDPRAREKDVVTLARALFGRSAEATPSEAPVVAGPVHPPRSDDELAELVTAIRKGAIDDVAGPARRIQHAAPSLWPALRQLLLAPRKAPKGDYRSTLAAIGGDVPNRYGHFELAWKKAHGFPTKLSQDWFEDLLAMPRSKLSPGLAPVFRDCVLTTAALQAASQIAKDPAYSEAVVQALLDAAYVHEGTFRDEVGRAIARIGDEAVPPLLRASIPPEGGDELALRRAEYAQLQLDRMDRWIPDRAEQALRAQPRLLAEAFDAWGQARNGHAAVAMLAHADSRVPIVRVAARAAFRALVEGPPPKTVSRAVRLLGGGTGRAQAYLNHRQLAAIAIRDALVRLDPSALEAPCEPPPSASAPPPDPACDAQPARHTTAYFERLDAARERDTKAAIARAIAAPSRQARIAALDRLLAERPELADSPILVEAYRDGAAAALQQGDAGRAAALSRKASVLVRPRDAALADTLQVQALLAEATLPELSPWGREMLLRSAAALRPDDEHVRAALAATQPAVLGGGDALSPRRIGLGCGLVGLAFACLVGVRALQRPRRHA